MIDEATFDGATFHKPRDHSRLAKQLGCVKTLMLDGEWRGLDEIAFVTGHPVASISARLRDLRKPKFGGFHVERRYIANGRWQYRIAIEKAA